MSARKWGTALPDSRDTVDARIAAIEAKLARAEKLEAVLVEKNVLSKDEIDQKRSKRD